MSEREQELDHEKESVVRESSKSESRQRVVVFVGVHAIGNCQDNKLPDRTQRPQDRSSDHVELGAATSGSYVGCRASGTAVAL